MPATKLFGRLFAIAGTSVPAGTLRSAPVIGDNILDLTASYGGEIEWRITNGGALGAGCVIEFQISRDQADWHKYDAVTVDDYLSGTITEGPSVPLRRGPMYLRAIAYGNTTSACTVKAGAHITTVL